MGHKKRVTMCYDPNLASEFGNQCMLRATGMQPTQTKFAWLREQVAERLKKARLMDETIAGIKVHDVLRMEGMTLKAYLAATRSSMWASQIELEIGARVLSVAVLYMFGRVCMQLGAGTPKYAIKKVKSAILHVPVHGMRILDVRDMEWRTCATQDDQVICARAIERGGRRREISPTVPYDNEDHYDNTENNMQNEDDDEVSEKLQQQRRNEQIESAPDRRRSDLSTDSRLPTPRHHVQGPCPSGSCLQTSH